MLHCASRDVYLLDRVASTAACRPPPALDSLAVRDRVMMRLTALAIPLSSVRGTFGEVASALPGRTHWLRDDTRPLSGALLSDLQKRSPLAF
jgi:hypothetical protein